MSTRVDLYLWYESDIDTFTLSSLASISLNYRSESTFFFTYTPVHSIWLDEKDEYKTAIYTHKQALRTIISSALKYK